jgi:hypothetical protein
MEPWWCLNCHEEHWVAFAAGFFRPPHAGGVFIGATEHIKPRCGSHGLHRAGCKANRVLAAYSKKYGSFAREHCHRHVGGQHSISGGRFYIFYSISGRAGIKTALCMFRTADHCRLPRSVPSDFGTEQSLQCRNTTVRFANGKRGWASMHTGDDGGSTDSYAYRAETQRYSSSLSSQNSGDEGRFRIRTFLLDRGSLPKCSAHVSK